MTDTPRSKFFAQLDEDAQLATALRRLPAAQRSGDWPMAERAARAAAVAAVGRALCCAMRGLLSGLRARVPQMVNRHRPGAAAAS